ncbi:MAG: hypothetical protein JOY80_08270 [Candidatus Dormibacteraeota bacterium]|nr:hypothetical protein [Candidatus Dormibacteraeota bacterium]
MTSIDRPARRRSADTGPALPFALPQPELFPSALRPEVATPCREPFEDVRWRFSVDWDGIRALLFVSAQGEVRLLTEAATDIAARFPELRRAAEHLSRLPVVLDGAVVVLDHQGRPDLETLGLRSALGADGALQVPAAYLATDVLHAGTGSTLEWALERRLELLAELVTSQGILQAPETVEGRGVALAAAAGERGLGAVMARRAAAPYRPGLPSPDRLHIALRSRTTCVVVGVEEGAQRPQLLLAEYDGGRLLWSGRVKGPRHTVVERWLADRAAAAAVAESPLSGPRLHRFTRAGDVIWLRPSITATVGHRGRLADGSLRDPSLIAVRDDADPRGCLRREPVPPPQAEGARTFAPTVLLPLPLA